jgi:hypothetical protein
LFASYFEKLILLIATAFSVALYAARAADTIRLQLGRLSPSQLGGQAFYGNIKPFMTICAFDTHNLDDFLEILILSSVVRIDVA